MRILVDSLNQNTRTLRKPTRNSLQIGNFIYRQERGTDSVTMWFEFFWVCSIRVQLLTKSRKFTQSHSSDLFGVSSYWPGTVKDWPDRTDPLIEPSSSYRHHLHQSQTPHDQFQPPFCTSPRHYVYYWS
ncbi:unnamed protein product [Nesidiocoris tenuis]|uniref:Uncharacterized protein n=1 Tax=Nesidiocoris tenuis TaxID=355587 RepID=A0A6H5H536_9HEMI|nr:unnamed protein product [Nesidiocoris tenuis]